VVHDPERARAVAGDAIRPAAEVKNNPPDLINVDNPADRARPRNAGDRPSAAHLALDGARPPQVHLREGRREHARRTRRAHLLRPLRAAADRGRGGRLVRAAHAQQPAPQARRVRLTRLALYGTPLSLKIAAVLAHRVFPTRTARLPRTARRHRPAPTQPDCAAPQDVAPHFSPEPLSRGARRQRRRQRGGTSVAMDDASRIVERHAKSEAAHRRRSM
jgi:hypothetical protein